MTTEEEKFYGMEPHTADSLRKQWLAKGVGALDCEDLTPLFAALDALREENEKLREALRPFAVNPEDLEDCRLFDEPPEEDCDCAWCRAKIALREALEKP